MNAPLRADGGPAPSEEYLVYQTLVGAWPLERERLVDYMVKAMREAKVTTDWVDPDEDHEQAVRRFIARLYRSEAFLADLEAFVAEVAPRGEEAALGQTLLKLTAPGVPDLYQGDELWCLSLVRPRQSAPGRLGASPAAAGRPARRRAAAPRDGQAVPDPPRASAAGAPPRGLRRLLPPPRRGRGRLRLRARRRRDRGDAHPRWRGGRADRCPGGPARALARRPRRPRPRARCRGGAR